ncbi:peptidoglycan-binding domain-containing protein [Caulobacter sp. DWR1-3-2b1]|uniref:peptidoglycan-binding domain-containing protein n=1 Tax=Caulobacter sp. DWR1-3-2b1 TaxID=2804670 RepID=UPI003CE72B28
MSRDFARQGIGLALIATTGFRLGHPAAARAASDVRPAAKRPAGKAVISPSPYDRRAQSWSLPAPAAPLSAPAPPPPQQPTRPAPAEPLSLVVKAQIRLTALGYIVGPIDGRPGGQTELAVRAFQRSVGLADTGVLDSQTLVELGLIAPPPVHLIGPRFRPPTWRVTPNPQDYAGYYPETARIHRIPGQAMIRCAIGEDGTLNLCITLSQQPEGYGFGGAALGLSRLFRVETIDVEGRSVVGHMVAVPIIFQVQ